MKKSPRRIIAVLLALFMAFGSFAVTAGADQSGSCGTNNVTYTITGSTLSITGNGEITRFTKDAAGNPNTPWYSVRDSITTVTVGPGVTSIGSFAFMELENLTNVTLPEGLVTLEQWVFWGCGSLKELTIPSTVKSIGNECFKYTADGIKIVFTGSSVDNLYNSFNKSNLSNAKVIVPVDFNVGGVDAVAGKTGGAPFYDNYVGFANGKATVCWYAPEGWAYLTEVNINPGTVPSQVPTSIPDGYTFKGWTPEPVAAEANEIYVYTAQFEKQETPAHDHVWDDGTVTTAATCVAKGVKTYTCTVEGCDETRTEEIEIDATNHVNKVTVPATDSTCIAHGYTEGVKCTDCGNFISGHEEKALAAHTWDAGTVSQPATCVAKGKTLYTCTVAGCGATETRTDIDINTKNHTGNNHVEKKNVVAATCQAGGSYNEVTVCECGAVISARSVNTPADPNNHTGGTEVRDAVAATCSAKGYSGDTYCLGCGNVSVKGSETELDPENHANYGTEVVNAKAATCGEDGYTGDTVCKGCKAVLASGAVISKDTVQHTLTKVAAKAPTCVDAGNIEHYVCSECGKYFSDAAGANEIAEADVVVAANGIHTLVHVDAVEATEDKDGNIEYWYCSVCGKCFTDAAGTQPIDESATVIPAKGGSGDSDEPSPAKPDGQVCPWCGEVHGDGIFERIIFVIHAVLCLFRAYYEVFSSIGK